MTDTPIWALQDVDFATTDADELAALIDDACDHDQSFVFKDSNDDPEKPLAVLLPWAYYQRLMSRALAPTYLTRSFAEHREDDGKPPVMHPRVLP